MLRVVAEAEVDHAQLLDVNHVDWQATELIRNQSHELHYIKDLHANTIMFPRHNHMNLAASR